MCCWRLFWKFYGRIRISSRFAFQIESTKFSAFSTSSLSCIGPLITGDSLARPEEAAAFFQQAADKSVEARDMVKETSQKQPCGYPAQAPPSRRSAAGNPPGNRAQRSVRPHVRAEEELDHPRRHRDGRQRSCRKRKAAACYLAYRRDGGENYFPTGRIALSVTQSLRAGNTPEAAALLQQLADDPYAAWLLTFIRALQAILAGSRDPALADAPELDYTMAAEILFLLETLEQSD